MKRNFLLFLALLVSLLLVINSTKRLLSLRTTSQKVIETKERLEELKKENEALRKELEYKQSQEFLEEEIRNKLGLVKKGEGVVIIPQEKISQKLETRNQKPEKNWQKWWNLFFGS